MRILVIKFRNIGDVLLLTPLLENLAFHFQDALIDVAINEEAVMMLEGNPHIHHIFPYQRSMIKKAKGLKRLLKEWEYFSNFIKESYDLVINTTEGDRGAFIAFLSRAKRVIAPVSRSFFSYKTTDVLPPYKSHIVESHLDCVRLLDKEVITKRVALFYDEACLKRVQELGAKGRYVHIHPLSRWQFKCIDDALFAKIIDYCQDELGVLVVVSAAPVKEELDRLTAILDHCKTKPLNLGGKITLKECAALSDHALAYIGVDTANTHMAAALNTPVIAFFVASAVFHWGAWDNDEWECPYVNADGIQEMGKHMLFVKNSAASDREIMANYQSKGTFMVDHFEFDVLKERLQKILLKDA